MNALLLAPSTVKPHSTTHTRQPLRFPSDNPLKNLTAVSTYTPRQSTAAATRPPHNQTGGLPLSEWHKRNLRNVWQSFRINVSGCILSLSLYVCVRVCAAARRQRRNFPTFIANFIFAPFHYTSQQHSAF